MAACSSACGWCGRCTEAWEHPIAVDDFRRCDTCGVALHWTDRGGRGPIQIVCLGEFCSDRCANDASEQHARAMQSHTSHSLLSSRS